MSIFEWPIYLILMNRINETEFDFSNFVGSLFRSAKSEWIDLIEEEPSIGQTTDLEIISMGDFNFGLA